MIGEAVDAAMVCFKRVSLTFPDIAKTSNRAYIASGGLCYVRFYWFSSFLPTGRPCQLFTERIVRRLPVTDFFIVNKLGFKRHRLHYRLNS